MARIGYARVSTRDQNPDAQGDRLTTAGVDKLFTDHGVSGKLARRPQLDAALEYLRPGDQLVITKLDRAGRSVKHLIEFVADLQARGVDLVVLDQAIDTTTASGKMMFHVLAAVAEFERDLISDRTLDGLEAARARGRKGGRKPKLTADQVALARRLYDARDHTVEQIGSMLGVTARTIYRVLDADKVT